jgi:hypothetical protein
MGMHIDASMSLLLRQVSLRSAKYRPQIEGSHARVPKIPVCMQYLSIPRDLLGNILNTRVRLEFCRSALPIDLALAQILDDRDDGIDRTDKLACGISFTGSSARHQKVE